MRKTGLLILASVLLPVIANAATININTANATQLDTLPGIGPTKAAAIVDYRTKNGNFASIEAIQNVSGIGPATFANIKDLITVGADTAAPAQNTAEPAQPPPSATSYQKVQAAPPSPVSKVEPVTSVKANAQNDDAVGAPKAANETVAAGAALPPLEAVAETRVLQRSSRFGRLGCLASS